jgi:hypothetical protein
MQVIETVRDFTMPTMPVAISVRTQQVAWGFGADALRSVKKQ